MIKAELARQTGRLGGGPVTLFVMYLTIIMKRTQRRLASSQEAGTGKGPKQP